MCFSEKSLILNTREKFNLESISNLVGSMIIGDDMS